MIDIFESTAQLRPEAVFFTAVDRRGNETAYTYRQARLIASQLARRLRDKGVFPGDVVAVDLPNGPMYVFLALAAAYGGFALVALNHRLTDAEKLTRLLELERTGLRVAYTVDAAGEPKLFEAVCNSLLRNERAGRVDDSLGGSVEDAIHFAERAAHVFDSSHRALIMFTSGTTGKPKAAELTWGNLVEASKASNRVLSGRVRGRGLWQAVLPFFHVGGFQVLVRSVCSRWPLRIYERFDAAAVLRDAEVMHATHISVVDKMLQDMLNARPDALSQYECVLLGGGPLNAKTVSRALEAEARVYASYGMTETSSQVANTLITPQFTGGMRLCRVIRPVLWNRTQPASAVWPCAGRGCSAATPTLGRPSPWTVSSSRAIRRRCTTAAFTCASAPATCSFPAVRTCTRPRSSMPWCAFPAWPTPTCSACPTRAGAGARQRW